MPNLDGGHYFLTALFPVLGDPVARSDGTITSPSHALREALASLPTAAQSEACIISNRRSPFGRCNRTHFARLVVLDQPAFNGRDPTNAIVQSLRKTDLLTHQPVDCLATPWLLMVVDFDPLEGEGDSLASYLRNLWTVMAPELRAVFRYCYGFDGVSSAESFADYVKRGQVETTMPFNDYWTGAPPFASLGFLALGIIGLFIFAGVFAIEWAAQHALGGIRHWLWLGIPAAIAITLWALFKFVSRRGSKPFPTAPGSDLQTILKALFLQQSFAEFAAKQQGADAATLFAAFDHFLRNTQPENTQSPSREPGVIAQ